jgi:hypothetical protein
VSPTAQKRQLRFQTEDDAIAEIERLRASRYKKLGSWSLPMICWHLDMPLDPPTRTKPTPAEEQRQRDFIDVILTKGKPPPKSEAPPDRVPSETAGDADVDHFIATLRTLKSYPHSHVAMGPFGPVLTEHVRALMLMHAAHHLGFLVPTSKPRRVGLQYKNEDEVIADIKRLRAGYERAGSWSLPQTCWHLEKTVLSRLRPGPFEDDTPEQTQRKAAIPQILAVGALPHGIVAPPDFVPPADAPESCVDAAIAALERLRDHKGEIAPHRFFGRLSDADARKLNLIHCAHHLSYLVPTN